MKSRYINVKAKPVRIGWCIQQNDYESLKIALELNHTLWGGRFNPIIPIGNDTNENNLIEKFNVDVLHNINGNEEVSTYINQFDYLKTPFPINCIDISHPSREIQIEKLDVFQPHFYTWSDKDPLSLILLASIGSYPEDKNYKRLFESLSNYKEEELDENNPLPSNLHNVFLPSHLSSYNIKCDKNESFGFYLGDSNDFDDLINFGNLRGANNNIWFYDPNYKNRLDNFKQSFIESFLKTKREHDHLYLFRKNNELDTSSLVGENPNIFLTYNIDEHTWTENDLDQKTRPPVVYFTNDSFLAFQEDNKLSANLPKKLSAHKSNESYNQNLIYSIHDLNLPLVKKLNFYYSRTSCSLVRVQRDGIGILSPIYTDHVDFFIPNKEEVIIELFKIYGIEANLSSAGKRAKHLISQMGRLQSCRIFKIKGVRDLLDKLRKSDSLQNIQDSIKKLEKLIRPLSIDEINKQNIFQQFDEVRKYLRKAVNKQRKSFSKSLNYVDAEHIILGGKPKDNSLRKEFEQKYGALFVEQREKPILSENDCLEFLLKKKVLQTGVEKECPNCALSFWLSLNDIKANIECPFCFSVFSFAAGLSDKKFNQWKIKPSGILTTDEQGSVPLVIFLQQMETTLGSPLIYTTSLEFKFDQNQCETDFVILHQHVLRDECIQLAIGECKSYGVIEQDDINKLKKLAEKLDKDNIDVFALFVKLSEFSKEEINLCKQLQLPHKKRVIILTSEQLEPYFLKINEKIPTTFIEMAQYTDELYFQ